MLERRRTVVLLEAIALSLVIGGINLAVPSAPGFRQLYYIPYMATGLLFGAIYGIVPGLISLGSSLAVLALLLPLSSLFGSADVSFSSSWSRLVTGLAVPLPVVGPVVPEVGLVTAAGDVWLAGSASPAAAA